MDHDDNVIAAAVLLVADRIRAAVELAIGRGGAHPAALTALHGWADGAATDALARGLGLSHSRTVRVVDELVRQGWARRGADPDDRRLALVELTDEGNEAARGVLDARAAALDDVLASIRAGDRAALATVASSILTGVVDNHVDARVVCRLCDLDACGFTEGRCPATPADQPGDTATGTRRAGPPPA